MTDQEAMVDLSNRKLSFSSTADNITLVESMVNQLCEELNIDSDHYGNILVAVTEAVTNAIQHGNKYDPEKNIDVSIEGSEKEVSFKIADQGDGFDFDNLPDPTDPENIEKPHGRGVFLMRNLADEVEFHEEGRIVELNFTYAS